MQLAGKKAVVLGASAEGGTGWAIAEGLAREGAQVIVASRTLSELERLAQRIGGFACACDGGSEADLQRLGAFAAARFGRIDIAVNSAGLPMLGTIDTLTREQLQRALDVNYLGNVWFMREMTRIMNDGGSVVVISSNSTTQPMLPHMAYACAKSAADCLVRYAALEYGARGIRVNSLLPGPIKSHMARELWAIPGVEEIFAAEVPLGRIGQPEDYANAVIWLSGPAYVTGLNLPVNGGNQLTRSPRPEQLPLGKESFEGDYR
jgi:NAD(P)-dependent dehydrogenase (short-subunit alcohol dehydrogenase family)